MTHLGKSFFKKCCDSVCKAVLSAALYCGFIKNFSCQMNFESI